ncbi:hypothetical protein MRX96_009242 [Rhipicephalus microplus]
MCCATGVRAQFNGRAGHVSAIYEKTEPAGFGRAPSGGSTRNSLYNMAAQSASEFRVSGAACGFWRRGSELTLRNRCPRVVRRPPQETINRASRFWLAPPGLAPLTLLPAPPVFALCPGKNRPCVFVVPLCPCLVQTRDRCSDKCVFFSSTFSLPLIDSGPSAARLDLRQKSAAADNMADQEDQQLIGFDDSPVVLPTESSKKSQLAGATTTNGHNGDAVVSTNGHNGDVAPNTNGHDEHEKTLNGHVPKANHIEAGEPVYTEVPEDNIYEEVIPMQDNKPQILPTAQTTPTESMGVLYDDSSLSSEVSAELSPPPSNIGDCGSNGTTLSDPECDAAMAEASAPESHSDIPFVVVQESTPVDSEQSNDEQDSASEAITEVASDVEPVVVETTGSTTTGSPASDERPPIEHCCDAQPVVLAGESRLGDVESEFTRVDDVQFVEPELAACCSVVSVTDTEPAVEECSCSIEAVTHIGGTDPGVEETSAQEQALSVEHELVHDPAECQDFTKEAGTASPVCEQEERVAEPPPLPTVRHESRHLKQSVEDSIVAREIRAQKEREEMIAQERKLAQEAARLSSAAPEKPSCDRAPETPKPARLTAPQLSMASATSPPSVVSSPAPFPAPIEKRFTCPSDSKIADEIRELQEREEELRELRERLHTQSNDHHKCSERTVSDRECRVDSSERLDFFGPRRKDKITVRPLSDATEDSVPSPTFVSGESPIEREIRLARDREEALRKEKGLLGQLQAEGFIKKGEAASPVKGAKVVPASMGLRGERTDSKVTRIGNETVVASPSTPIASATRRVAPFESSLPNVEIFEKTPARVSSPTTSACGVASAVAKAANGHVHANGHVVVAKASPVANVRGVSMQKFLASRGKELAFTSPPSPQNGDKLEYRELKPPQLQKGAVDAVRKGLVTAETKIQEEMRAMKEREEELRRQRLRLLGQPNLGLFEGGTLVDADHAVDAGEAPALHCVASDASLLEHAATGGSPEASSASNSVPRRRSALIAQWEQMIHSTDVAKS